MFFEKCLSKRFVSGSVGTVLTTSFVGASASNHTSALSWDSFFLSLENVIKELLLESNDFSHNLYRFIMYSKSPGSNEEPNEFWFKTLRKNIKEVDIVPFKIKLFYLFWVDKFDQPKGELVFHVSERDFNSQLEYDKSIVEGSPKEPPEGTFDGMVRPKKKYEIVTDKEKLIFKTYFGETVKLETVCFSDKDAAEKVCAIFEKIKMLKDLLSTLNFYEESCHPKYVCHILSGYTSITQGNTFFAASNNEKGDVTFLPVKGKAAVAVDPWGNRHFLEKLILKNDGTADLHVANEEGKSFDLSKYEDLKSLRDIMCNLKQIMKSDVGSKKSVEELARSNLMAFDKLAKETGFSTKEFRED